MIPLTRADLEALAFDHPGSEIRMAGNRATLHLGGITYAAVLPPVPTVIDELAADPRVTLSATGSFLDAEPAAEES